ncbi:MAG: ATP-binding protein [Candidatus Jorgensenbacteria bacterium]|nr:ATP-binding protein [Candidatus Jorgensenbacteria bacterium]
MEEVFEIIKTTIKNVAHPAFRPLVAVIIVEVALFVVYLLAFTVSSWLVLLTILVGIGTAAITAQAYVKLISTHSETAFNEEMLLALTEYLKDAVIIYDTNFKIISINPAAETLFSVAKESVINATVDPGSVKQRNLKLFAQILFPSLAPAVAQISEANAWPQVVRISISEPNLSLLVTTNRIADRNGGVIGFVKLVKDETHEESILKAKNEFIDVAAHQLRTPLTALHWTLESMTKMTEGAPDLHELSQQGLLVAERALKITNDLLDVSKIEEGRFGYAPQRTDIIGLIKTVLRETNSLAKQYNVELADATREQNIPVYIDVNSIGMVLMNLVDNAIKYNTKNGKVVVSAEQAANNRSVRVSVTDTGIGITEEDMKKLFEKLHRGANAAQIEPNGSGLGLYIAKNIVERNNGKIGVESTLNRGSTFWFTLPIVA